MRRRQAADVHDLAGQHEEGHGQQREAVGAVDHVLRQDLRVEHVQVPHQRDAADEQRVGDGHAQRHGAEQRAEEDERWSWRLAPAVPLRPVQLDLRQVFRLLHHHQFVVAEPAAEQRARARAAGAAPAEHGEDHARRRRPSPSTSPVTGASTSQLMRVCARLPSKQQPGHVQHQQLAEHQADPLARCGPGAPTSMSVPRWPCSFSATMAPRKVIQTNSQRDSSSRDRDAGVEGVAQHDVAEHQHHHHAPGTARCTTRAARQMPSSSSSMSSPSGLHGRSRRRRRGGWNRAAPWCIFWRLRELFRCSV